MNQYKNWASNKKIPKDMVVVFGYVIPEEIECCFPEDDELIKNLNGWIYFIEDMQYNVFTHIWRYD